MSPAFLVVLVTLELHFLPSGENLSPAVAGVNLASELPARTSRDNVSSAFAFAVAMEQPVSSLSAFDAWTWHVLPAEVCGVTTSRG